MRNLFKYYFFIIAVFLMAVSSCTKEAPVVNLGDYVAPPTGGGEPGYSYPYVTAIYPGDGATNVPTNTSVVIVFNIPIDPSTVSANITVESPVSTLLTLGVHYNITTGTNYVTINFIGAMNPIPYSRSVRINVLSGIKDRDNGINIDLPSSILLPVTFSTGLAPDVAAPLLSVNTPTGAGQPVATNVQITLNETIDPSTINNGTFYLMRTSDSSVVEATYLNANPVFTLDPVNNLQDITNYTVVLTSGIKDLAGNAYAGTSWAFTTVDVDIIGGNPTLSGTPSVGPITGTTATINWTTNEYTNYTIDYGTASTFPFGSSVNNLITYDVVHSRNLVGLTAGKRYYYRIVFADQSGNSTTSATYQFNTQTPEAPSIISSGAGNQMQVKYIPQKAGVASTGAFVFWYDLSAGNYDISASLYNSTFATEWSGSIFTNGANQYYYSAVEDEVGGVIVLASSGATGVYAKRINDGGASPNFVNWGPGTTTSGGIGLPIDSSGLGTKASAVPVCSGILNQLATGTVEMSNLPNANVFYDFDIDFTTATAVTNGDIVINTVTNSISTVTIPWSNFNRHTLYQNSIAAIAGNSYRVIDSAVTQPGTANYPNPLVNGTTTVYASTNTFAAPGWLTAAAAPSGDIMEVNGVYVFITALNTSFSGLVSSGTNQNNLALGHLVDSTADWGVTEPVSVGDTVTNTSTSATTTIAVGGVTATNLTLNANIFSTAGGQGYDITGTVDLGTSDAGAPTAFHLIDSGALWTTTNPVNDGDTVVNTSTSATTTVAVGGVTATDLTLNADIFLNVAGSEGYHIYRSNTGTSSIPANVNYLYDSIASFGDGTTGPVYVGDIVYNTTDSTNATVTGVTNTQLTLSAAIFNPAGGDAYEVYDTFYRFTLSSPVDILTDPTFNLYDNTAIKTGTADTPPTNPLYDNNPGTIFTTLGLVAGDIVFNYTIGKGTYGQVNTGSFAVRDRAFDITGPANMFADTDTYRILRFLNGNTYADIRTSGIATGGSSSTLVDAGNNFTGAGVIAGDVAYNLTDGYYTRITIVTANTLTLSGDATFGAGDRYIIIRETVGVLYVWQDAGPSIHANVLNLAGGGVPTTLVAEWTIAASGQNPYLVSTGRGNAIVVYEDTSVSPRKIRSRRINVIGGITAGQDIDNQGALDETILRVITDNNGGVIVLYGLGPIASTTINTLRVQRLDYAVTRQYGLNGRSVGNPAAINLTMPVSDAVDIVYNNTTDSQIITAQIGNDIWANRINVGPAYPWGGAGIYISNPAGTSIQQKPKIFIDSTWTNARIVWEDNRFVTGGGYGIFSQLVTAATGVLNWYADTTLTDNDGVAVVLNILNGYWPNVIVVPYNNNGSANIIWDDWRNGNADVMYESLSGFIPY